MRGEPGRHLCPDTSLATKGRPILHPNAPFRSPGGALAEDAVLFAGTANPALAEAVARALKIAPGRCRVDRFPDGEVSVWLDESVRRREVFIVQPTCPPVNENLVELLAFADACRRASAAFVTAVVPYFGYGRADKRDGRREPIMASTVADLFQAVEIDHVLTVELHTPQIEGFFHVPVDSLSPIPALCDALADRLPEETVVVSPDAGRVKMATLYARRLQRPLVVLHKERQSGTQTVVTHLVGDVRDRPCLIVDDMISTGGTLVESIDALRQAGARPEFYVAAPHGLLLGNARERLAGAGIRELLVTDTVPARHPEWPELRVVSVAPLIAMAIARFMSGESLSDLR